VDLVNQTWARRDEIEPDTTTHKRLQPLELYRLLPRTNCRACGEDTCFNFALKLVAAQSELARCTPLYGQEGFEEERSQLESLLSTKWPVL
jgi:ArsR family metal-binding transcriptional regulator